MVCFLRNGCFLLKYSNPVKGCLDQLYLKFVFYIHFLKMNLCRLYVSSFVYNKRGMQAHIQDVFINDIRCISFSPQGFLNTPCPFAELCCQI